MRCPKCRHENAAGQKFCGECGARLTVGCAACGSVNPPGQKFCGECGASLTDQPAAPKFASPDAYTPKHLANKILTSRIALGGERKQITVLFADIKGSLELIEGSDPEQAAQPHAPIVRPLHGRRPTSTQDACAGTFQGCGVCG